MSILPFRAGVIPQPAKLDTLDVENIQAAVWVPSEAEKFTPPVMPRGIAWDTDLDRLYILDDDTGRIKACDAQGNEVRGVDYTVINSQSAIDIAYHDGLIFVVHNEAGRASKFSRINASDGSVNVAGDTALHLTNTTPHAATYHDGYLLIWDVDLHRVFAYDTSAGTYDSSKSFNISHGTADNFDAITGIDDLIILFDSVAKVGRAYKDGAQAKDGIFKLDKKIGDVFSAATYDNKLWLASSDIYVMVGNPLLDLFQDAVVKKHLRRRLVHRLDDTVRVSDAPYFHPAPNSLVRQYPLRAPLRVYKDDDCFDDTATVTSITTTAFTRDSVKVLKAGWLDYRLQFTMLVRPSTAPGELNDGWSVRLLKGREDSGDLELAAMPVQFAQFDASSGARTFEVQHYLQVEAGDVLLPILRREGALTMANVDLTKLERVFILETD